MPGVAKQYIAKLLEDGTALMGMGFVDTDVMITCLTGGDCALTFRGDSASDAWNLWYEHLAQAHPRWGE